MLLTVIFSFFVILGTAILSTILYLKRKLDFWKRRGIPSISNVDQMKSLQYSFTKTILQFELEMYEKYAKKYPIYGAFLGTSPHLNITDPEIIKHILVKDFHLFSTRRHFVSGEEIFDGMVSVIKGDEKWKRIRSVLSPTFSSGKMRTMSVLISECTNNLEGTLEKASQDGTSIDVKGFFGAFAMDVIATCAFATKINSTQDPNNPFVKNAAKFFDRSAFSKADTSKLMVTFFLPQVAKILNIKFGDIFRSSSQFFKKITLKIIQERKNSNEKRGDFLQLVMDAMKNEKNEEHEEDEKDHYAVGEENYKNIFNITGKQKTLSEDELVSQCVMFFVVGYETTGTLMACTAYELALNQDVQEQLCEEVDRVFEENQVIDFDVVYKMQYLDRVISETLRKYPPLLRVERTASEEYKLPGDSGISVPKGCVVSIPVIGMHRDPQFYPNPEVFDPDRFLPEERANRNPYLYLPFGAGPRNCIAMRFALMEAKLGIVHALRNSSFTVHQDTKIPMEYINNGGLVCPKNCRVGVARRK